jgi:ankyrin repeat protein
MMIHLVNSCLTFNIDWNKQTALHLTSMKGLKEAARMLIKKGANINAKGIFFYQLSGQLLS